MIRNNTASLILGALGCAVLACEGDRSPTASRGLSPNDVRPRTSSGVLGAIDPFAMANSPITVQVGATSTNMLTYTYEFGAIASGASSGQYHYIWRIQTCYVDDSCSEYYDMASGDGLDTFTWQATEDQGAAYFRVIAQVHEAGNPSYYSTISNGLLRKGPLWNVKTGGNWNQPCSGGDYPLAEHTIVEGALVVKYYTRNFCNGNKVPAP